MIFARCWTPAGSKPAVRQHATRIFTRLAEAEGQVHGVSPDDVEFHEVGAIDSIVDIVGTAIGINALNVERVYVSPIPLGSGVVASQHGPLPVPGPATAALLHGYITRPGDGEGELVTPTGAAIVAGLGAVQGTPSFRIDAVGYGAGERITRDRPNVLRLMLGQPALEEQYESQVIIETNIDDMNPEIYDHVMERLFTAGARDVFLTDVHMKKNRPGVIVSVLCSEANRDPLSAILLNETSAIGLRYYRVERIVLSRQTREVLTPYGTVRVKVARGPDGRENIAPEYEDCRRLASSQTIPIKIVYQAAVAAALNSSIGQQ